MKNNNRGDAAVEIILLFLMATLVFGGGCVVGSISTGTSARKEIRTEAVRKGYAEWVVDVDGNTTFVWKCDKK